MNEWLNWLISLIQTSLAWLASVSIFGVPVIAILIGIFVMEVMLRALLYKA